MRPPHLSLPLALTLAARVAAEDIDWTGNTNGDFSNPLNWSTQQVPGTTDRAVFSSGDNTIHTVQLGLSQAIGSLLVSNDLLQLDLSRNSLDLDGPDGLQIQPSAFFNASLLITNGTLLAKRADILPLPDATATVNISGSSSAWIVAGDIKVGSAAGPTSGQARLILAGGARISATGQVLIEGAPGTPGILDLTGTNTRITADIVHFARSFSNCDSTPSSARATISAGASIVATTWFLVGGGLSEAHVAIAGPGTRVDALGVSVGDACFPGSAIGTLTIQDQAIVASGDPTSNGGVVIGHEFGIGHAIISGAGTVWTNASYGFSVGKYGGRGTLSIDGGAQVHTLGMDIGTDNAAGTKTNTFGSVTVSGHGSRIVCGVDLRLGGTDGTPLHGGTGRLVITNGASVEVGRGLRMANGSELDLRNGQLTISPVPETRLQLGELFVVGAETGLGGAGLIRANLRNSGTVETLSGTDAWTVEGDFDQIPGGTLGVPVSGSAMFPVLHVSGSARLDGRLELRLPPGFVSPPPGQFIPILTCRERIGSFSEVLGNRIVGTDYTLQPIYTRTGVLLEARLNPPELIANDPPDVGLGQSLTLSNPVFGPGPFTFQWLLNGVVIPDQTNRTLVLPELTRPQGGDYTLVASSPAGTTVGPTNRVLFPNSFEVRDFFDAYPFTSPEPPTGDIESASGTLASRNFDAAPDYQSGEPLHAGVAGGRSVWISWRAPESGVVTFDTQGSTFDTLLAGYVWRPSLDELFTARLDDDDDGGAYATSRIRFNAQKGVTYVIAVAGYSPSPGEIASGHFLLGWSLENGAEPIPLIRSHPESRIVQAGSPAQLGFRSSGATAFQWFKRTSGAPVPLVGEVGVNLTFPAFTMAQVGEYLALLTSQGGATNWTRPARLEMGDANLPLAGRPKQFFEPSLAGPAVADLRPHSPFVSGFLPLNAGFKAAPYPTGSGTRQAQLRDCAARLTDGFWYGFQALTSGVVTMTCSNSIPLRDTFPVLGVYRDGGNDGDRVLQECSRATIGSGFTRVQFEAVSDTTYSVVVGASGNHPDDALFHLSWETRSFRSVFAPAERDSQTSNSMRIRKLLPQGIVQFRKSAGFVLSPSQAIPSPSDASWTLMSTTNWTGGLLEWVQPMSTASPTVEFFDLSWNGDFPVGASQPLGNPTQ